MSKARFFLSISTALSFIAAFSPVAAEDRVSMEIRGSGLAPGQGIALDVTGSGGRYDEAKVRSSVVPVILSAAVTARDPHIKIVAAELSVASENKGNAGETDELISKPARTLDTRDVSRAALGDDAGLANDAIAACNRLPAKARQTQDGETLLISVPVVWRVTTGRFSFKWTGYDRVGPSDEIVGNADFYRDREVSERTTTIAAEVICQPFGVAVSKSTKGDEVKDTPEIKTAVADAPAKPRCDGGMVREISSGAQSYLCLCPGNTKRVEKGSNVFACVRPRRRN